MGYSRRRRQPGILRYCRVSAKSTPFGRRSNACLRSESRRRRAREYEPIEAPRNSPTGFVTAFFAVITGFALIWHIWWLAGVGALGGAATLLAFMFRSEDEVEISAEEVAQFDRSHPRGGVAMSAVAYAGSRSAESKR